MASATEVVNELTMCRRSPTGIGYGAIGTILISQQEQLLFSHVSQSRSIELLYSLMSRIAFRSCDPSFVREIDV